MANLEVLALDPTAPQIEAPQTGNGYSMPRLVNIAPEAVTGAAATPSVAVAQTWNTTGTPTALQVNVTDTASNAASKLLDLQVGGVSKFSVDKSGTLASPVFSGALTGAATVSVPAPLVNLAQTWTAITVTGASGTGTTATLTFAAQTAAIPVGTPITVAGMTPTGYNTTNGTVTASSTTSVSYANTATGFTTGGTVATAMTAVLVNVTDTTSKSGSKIFDLQQGGVSQFSVSNGGALTLPNSTNIAPDTGGGGNGLIFSINGTANVLALFQEGFKCSSTVGFVWGSGGANGPRDLSIYRDAANTLAQRNGVNAQAFNLYNTYTSGSVYERVSLYAASNVFYLGSNQTGATLRPLLISHGATAYAALPAANTCEGARAYVTDSVLATFGAIVAGGGANKTVVWSNGTNWLVG